MSLRDFQDILTDIGDGTLHAQLTMKLPEVVKAVVATRRSGKLTLTLDFDCENNMVVAKGSVKATIPQPAVDATMFYSDEDGNVTRDNPKQMKLRAVLDDARRAPPVVVPAATTTKPKE